MQHFLQFSLWSALYLRSFTAFCRFLLARHRAALDVYSEAQKMSPSDWVIDNCYWLFTTACHENLLYAAV